jgi:hypothetical protein
MAIVRCRRSRLRCCMNRAVCGGRSALVDADDARRGTARADRACLAMFKDERIAGATLCIRGLGIIRYG